VKLHLLATLSCWHNWCILFLWTTAQLLRLCHISNSESALRWGSQK
jgi:hypothetical protein